MIHPWHDVSPGATVPYDFNAVIEIPAGSSVRYELDKTSGLMSMIDAGKVDYKIISVALDDPSFNAYRQASEMPPHQLTMLKRFFQDYKQLEGKSVEVGEFQPAEAGYPVIEQALVTYSKQRRTGFQQFSA